jgi:peptide/nickel transport system substrate-binding protein
MKERELRDLIADVKTGRLSRRAFVQRMIAVGLTAPMAGMMLSHSGVAMAETAIPYKPTKAGGGGLLKLLYWQAVTLLNPHFAVGTKDQEGSRIFYEPLAGWTMKAIWFQFWPPRFRARTMMVLLRTASRSSGS